MRAPVSWLRDCTSTCRPTSHATSWPDRLTALGLKLEALERPGHDITGPLVVGRVLTLEDEPQKNGKTIRWCPVDVGAANGTGEPQGIVCGAHNFAVGDLVVVVAARRRAARRLRDLRAQDLRPRVRRDDLLGQASSASATTTTASSCCPPTPASPATTRSSVLHAARRRHRVRDQPRPGLRPVAARCGPRGGAGLRRARSTTRPTAPVAGWPSTATRSWSRTRPAARCSRLARSTGFDPTAPDPALAGAPRAAGRACGRSRSPSTSPTT